MQQPRLRTTLLAALVALSGAALMLSTAPAQARQRSTTVTGPNGKTVEHEVTRSKGDVQSSTTGPNGKTSSRSVDRSASGTTATLTGPNGKTVTRSTTRQP